MYSMHIINTGIWT